MCQGIFVEGNVRASPVSQGPEIDVRMAPGSSEAMGITRQCGSFDLRSAVLSSCTQLDQCFRLLSVI